LGPRQRGQAPPWCCFPKLSFPGIFIAIYLDNVKEYCHKRVVQAPPAPLSLSQTFGLIIGGLCAAVAKRIAADRTSGPLILLTVARLRHLLARFTKLAARAEAGKLPPPRQRTVRPRREPPLGREPPPGEASPGDPTPDPKPLRQPERLLPKKFGWLIQFVPYEAACFGSQLQHQFSQPKMVALIEAAPQAAGRILRPLCWMLAIPLPANLRLPPRPRKPRPPKQPRPERTCDVAPANGRKPRHPPSRGADGTVFVWRRWRDIWMPEPLRPPKPA
jgi:hypothetical protein